MKDDDTENYQIWINELSKDTKDGEYALLMDQNNEYLYMFIIY